MVRLPAAPVPPAVTLSPSTKERDRPSEVRATSRRVSLGGAYHDKLFANVLDTTLHIEILFRHIIMFAVQDFFETTNGVG